MGKEWAGDEMRAAIMQVRSGQGVTPVRNVETYWKQRMQVHSPKIHGSRNIARTIDTGTIKSPPPSCTNRLGYSSCIISYVKVKIFIGSRISKLLHLVIVFEGNVLRVIICWRRFRKLLQSRSGTPREQSRELAAKTWPQSPRTAEWRADQIVVFSAQPKVHSFVDFLFLQIYFRICLPSGMGIPCCCTGCRLFL